jgi:hypothetical protein
MATLRYFLDDKRRGSATIAAVPKAGGKLDWNTTAG